MVGHQGRSNSTGSSKIILNSIWTNNPLQAGCGSAQSPSIVGPALVAVDETQINLDLFC